MTVLPDTDRTRVLRGLSRWWSNKREPVNVKRADLLAAVAATDAWIESNQAAFNAALPVAARNGLTATQKTLLFCAIALMRVDIALLRAVFAEVD